MVYSYLFPICYLEHLDSLSLRHAKRLMSWVRLHLHGQSSAGEQYDWITQIRGKEKEIKKKMKLKVKRVGSAAH